MSETAGLIGYSRIGGERVAGAFEIAPGLELRLDADGELCVRAPWLMTGYLERDDEAGCFTGDGLFRTGDLARSRADGRLEIIGRKKRLLVLPTRNKVPPHPLQLPLPPRAPFSPPV